MKFKSNKDLYNFAKSIIPGGTTLFSKRSELHLPDKWPSYFSKAKKNNVWDLNGVKYLDMFCAVGTSILGYSNDKITSSVQNNIKKGNLTTLNCPEEITLAEQIIKHHSWASMAKFTRGGGEANAVAIRIARACTKKKNVAFCGYHGWHDWYLSANINSKKNLDQHLMSGLNYDGIPEHFISISL
jgi:glutamate-1-semialdehyde aminotransferase